ncbi:MAG: beta-propeller domain-containing protein [Patescibacteria group bacterium]|nr:beta-propeller domain-containing protein [Patescibacteria group bacterium]
MKKNKKYQLKKLIGQSLIEVILAVALLAIFASSLSVYLNNQLAYMTRGQNALEAIYLAQEGLEASRSIRDMGWEYLATGTHGLVYSGEWNFAGTEEGVGKFTRKILIDDISENERSVISWVTWPGTTALRSIMLATNLSNWREIVEPLLEGDWGYPTTLGSVDLGPGNTPTGLVVRNGILYMSAQASSAAKPDFFVVDVSNGISPVIVGQIDTSPGLNGVDVAGDFVFLANQDASNQLQIANISDPNNPYLISSYRLIGNTSQALAIAATGTTVFIGTANDAGSELYTINVSNPSTPSVLNNLEIGADVNNIFINGDTLYLATSQDDNEVVILDISNPANPTVTASLNLPNTNDALSVFVNYQDNRLYVSRKADGTANSPEIVIYNVTDKNNPQLLGSMEFSNDVYSAYAADGLMFIATSYSSQEFQVYRASDPANLMYWTGLNFPQLAVDMDLENNTIYMSIRSNDALRIITSQ